MKSRTFCELILVFLFLNTFVEGQTPNFRNSARPPIDAPERTTQKSVKVSSKDNKLSIGIQVKRKINVNEPSTNFENQNVGRAPQEMSRRSGNIPQQLRRETPHIGDLGTRQDISHRVSNTFAPEGNSMGNAPVRQDISLRNSMQMTPHRQDTSGGRNMDTFPRHRVRVESNGMKGHKKEITSNSNMRSTPRQQNHFGGNTQKSMSWQPASGNNANHQEGTFGGGNVMEKIPHQQESFHGNSMRNDPWKQDRFNGNPGGPLDSQQSTPLRNKEQHIQNFNSNRMSQSQQNHGRAQGGHMDAPENRRNQMNQNTGNTHMRQMNTPENIRNQMSQSQQETGKAQGRQMNAPENIRNQMSQSQQKTGKAQGRQMNAPENIRNQMSQSQQNHGKVRGIHMNAPENHISQMSRSQQNHGPPENHQTQMSQPQQNHGKAKGRQMNALENHRNQMSPSQQNHGKAQMKRVNAPENNRNQMRNPSNQRRRQQGQQRGRHGRRKQNAPISPAQLSPRRFVWNTAFPNGGQAEENAEMLHGLRLILINSENIPFGEDYYNSATVMDFGRRQMAIRVDLPGTKICFLTRTITTFQEAVKELRRRGKSKTPLELGEVIHRVAAARNRMNQTALRRRAGNFILKFCKDAVQQNNVFQLTPEATIDVGPQTVTISGLIHKMEHRFSIPLSVAVDASIDLGANAVTTSPFGSLTTAGFGFSTGAGMQGFPTRPPFGAFGWGWK